MNISEKYSVQYTRSADYGAYGYARLTTSYVEQPTTTVTTASSTVKTDARLSACESQV